MDEQMKSKKSVPVTVNDHRRKVSMSDPQVKTGPADDTSVRQLFDMCKDVFSNIMSKDYLAALNKGGKIISIFTDLFSINVWGAIEEISDSEIEALLKKAEECKENLIVKGDEEADPSKIDPATIMLIVELIIKFIEFIRKRRNPNA